MEIIRLFSLPNILTLINLFSGTVAIIFLFSYRMEWVPYCVVVSLVADFLDGFAARLTKHTSDIGKELDSLADVVSFGLVPGLILFQLLFQKYESDEKFYSTTQIYLYSAPALLITLFAALRLAKFNVDTRQSDSFLGLATPAMTIFVVGFMLIVQNNSLDLTHALFQRKWMYLMVLILSLLMVIELPMFSFKFKHFRWKGNEMIYLFLIVSAFLLTSLKFAAISLIIIIYVGLSLAIKLLKR